MWDPERTGRKRVHGVTPDVGTIKYEDVYIRGYEEVPELQSGLGRYFTFYNHARPHQALGYRTPAAVYGTSGPRGLDERAAKSRRILV